MINSRRFSKVPVRELANDIRPLDPEIQGQTNGTANPNRMRTYTNAVTTPLEYALTKLLDLKSFRMRTYENDARGVGSLRASHLRRKSTPRRERLPTG